MTQLIRVFVTKPGDLCLIPRTHMVGENRPPPQKKNVSSDLHSQALASITLTLAN